VDIRATASEPLYLSALERIRPQKSGQKMHIFGFFFFTTLFGSRMIGLTEKRSNILQLFCFDGLGLDRRPA
jgi:hypothetical protein